MLNVIPTQQKIALKKEYSQRRIIVWLALIIFILASSIVLLVPSYLLTHLKAKEVEGELARSKQILSNELLPEEISNNLTAALGHAEALKPFRESISPYELIKIFENRPKTIKISEINFVNGNDKSGPTIMVQGMADNREALTAFAATLENRPEFESVDLPVSNFIKEEDIDFTVSIKLKKI